jgi:phosphopantothenoylcysteine decarboxylase/phosphopantothenate--cysteine ligase
LSLATVSGEKVFRDLFSLTDESEIGHIRLAREPDLVLVAPATANILAKMAAGIADDLATAVLLATDRPVMAAPAMNGRMWEHPATQANVARLAGRGVHLIGPEEGEMAEADEWGTGRMTEPADILAVIETFFAGAGRLHGRRAIVTSGPTYEAIDPVRYIANRSSGKQGHAIAGALARLGAETTLVSGPTHLPDPVGVRVVNVEEARDMLSACKTALPADVAVLAAAVADWRVAKPAKHKIKKDAAAGAPVLKLIENPDILASLSTATAGRPALVVGFAAETGTVVERAKRKRLAKGCDWIVANDVSSGVFGAETNTVHLVTAAGVEDWPPMTKSAVAQRLADRIADALEGVPATPTS